MKFNGITKTGQLKEGDLILVEKKNGIVFPAIVKEVLNFGDQEEILINKNRNIYFITSMMINGESWVKSVVQIPNGKMYSITNNIYEFI